MRYVTACVVLVTVVWMATDQRQAEVERLPSQIPPLSLAGPVGGLAVSSGGVEEFRFGETMQRLAAALREDHDPLKLDRARAEGLDRVIRSYCIACHNDQLRTGNFTLQDFSVGEAADGMAEAAEKVIKKLRLGMMPPPGMPRPMGDSLTLLMETLEASIDAASVANPNPGARAFQRLNQAEYARSIQQLLHLEIDPSAYLPPDTQSDFFDNIADVQMPSATVVEAYLNAASEIARLAVGDANATSREATFSVPRTVSQTVHIDGTPRGTRGGLSRLYTFPADGEYVFKASFYTTLTGNFFGRWARGEELEVSINGERVATIEVDRFLNQADPTAEWRESPPIFVRAGQHRVAAAFVRTFEGPVEDVVAPIRESLADLQVGYADGMTHLPHLWELIIQGPRQVTGVSETQSRRKIFTCRPTSSEAQRPCAEEIIWDLATEAYRRPLPPRELDRLMQFYEEGRATGGFEVGVRTGIQAILSSPDFVFRLEMAPGASREAGVQKIGDLELASRLSFFLWGAPPDRELLRVAQEESLSEEEVLRAQVDRMLRDPRAHEALATRFFGQWLRLQDLEKVYPDSDDWPYFDTTLKDYMLTETQLFLQSLVREDHRVLDLLDADYTYLNEDLARHYRIPGVAGPRFRRVSLQGDERRGILGHGSVLVSTSHADRTSPVRRGLWLMEVLMDSPPPPPPPNVPDLSESDQVQDGRTLTVKEQMEIHRANPTCNACHQYIDPLGLALENFDVTGEWRIRDAGSLVDAAGKLWDGSELNGPADVRRALLSIEEPVLRTFTKNLMAYALGRRVQYFDQPTIRRIVRQAEAEDHRLSAYIMGIVTSDAFLMRGEGAMADVDAEDGR